MKFLSLFNGSRLPNLNFSGVHSNLLAWSEVLGKEVNDVSRRNAVCDPHLLAIFFTSCRMSCRAQNLADSMIRLQPHLRRELVTVCHQTPCKNTQLLAHLSDELLWEFGCWMEVSC